MARTYKRDSNGRFAGGGSSSRSSRNLSAPRTTNNRKPTTLRKSKVKKLSADIQAAERGIERMKDAGRSPVTVGLMERGVQRMRQQKQAIKAKSSSRKRIASSLAKANLEKQRAIAAQLRKPGADWGVLGASLQDLSASRRRLTGRRARKGGQG